MKVKRLFLSILILIIFVYFIGICEAVNIKLGWDVDPSPGVNEYYVLVSTTGEFDLNNPEVIVYSDVYTADIYNLAEDTEYSIVVCSRNIAGLFSDFSRELRFNTSELCKVFPEGGGPPSTPIGPNGCFISGVSDCPSL